MSEKVFFSLPCKPDIRLNLKKDRLTFWNEYSGRAILTPKFVAQIGFDICENALELRDDIFYCFRTLTGITLDEAVIYSSKYAPVDVKVFGNINEGAAVYSLGVFLRDLLISTGRSDMRLRAILDKACEQYVFIRYSTFDEFKEDLAIYLRSEVDEEIYGVIITSDKPLPEPVFRHNRAQKAPDLLPETINYTPYSKIQKIRHSASKHLTLPRVQIILAVIFIVFSSISIPLTSVRQSHDIPTFSYFEQ